jgi:predicted nucleic acid-binding protein
VLHLGRCSEREHAKGAPISAADAWIAATALVLSAPLVTNNSKDYRHLDKLQIISAAAS